MIQICFERIRYHLTFYSKKKIWFNMCAKMFSTLYTEIYIFLVCFTLMDTSFPFFLNGYFLIWPYFLLQKNSIFLFIWIFSCLFLYQSAIYFILMCNIDNAVGRHIKLQKGDITHNRVLDSETNSQLSWSPLKKVCGDNTHPKFFGSARCSIKSDL